MRTILRLALSILCLTTVASAQLRVIRNDTPTTRYGNDLQTGPEIAVDQYGRLQTSSGATGGLADSVGVTSINTATANAAVTLKMSGYAQACWGWSGSVATGTGAFEVSYDSTTGTDGTWSASEVFDIDAADVQWNLSGSRSLASTSNYCIPGSGSAIRYARLRVSVTGAGTLPVSWKLSPLLGTQRISWVSPGTAANALGKAEDAAHTTGDVGVGCWAVRNSSNVTFAADGDYNPISTGANGQVFVDLNKAQVDDAGSVVKGEDSTAADGDGLVAIGFVREDPLTVSTGLNSEYITPKTDKFGRLNVSLGPEGSLFKCTSASDITDTNSTAVCVADADEIYNITAITCTNTDAAVGTRVDILDGATVVWQLAVGSGASETTTASQTFPTPLKMAAINTAINAQNATNSAQVRCSISGFKTPS